MERQLKVLTDRGIKVTLYPFGRYVGCEIVALSACLSGGVSSSEPTDEVLGVLHGTGADPAEALEVALAEAVKQAAHLQRGNDLLTTRLADLDDGDRPSGLPSQIPAALMDFYRDVLPASARFALKLDGLLSIERCKQEAETLAARCGQRIPPAWMPQIEALMRATFQEEVDAGRACWEGADMIILPPVREERTEDTSTAA